jgi:hypothetical protein
MLMGIGGGMAEQRISGGDVLENDFLFYRNCFENTGRQQGIEAEGIFDRADFAAVYNDPRTVRLSVAADGASRTVPLLTPLPNCASWFNLDFYTTYAGNRPLVYYNHLSPPYRRDPGAYVDALGPALRRLAGENGVLVFDHTNHEAATVSRELSAIAAGLSISYTDIEGPDGVVTPHYHYESVAKQPGQANGQPDGPVSLYDTYDKNRLLGVIPDDSVTVSPTLTPGDIEQAWSFYGPAFDELTASDPVKAGFTEDEFAQLMLSPDCIKFVNRVGQAIVNFCLMSDVRKCPWMNQFYYQQKYPAQYEQGRILCSLGVVANPQLGRAATTLRTVNMMGKIIKLSGTEPVVTFACDTASNKNVPRLAQHSFTSAGVEIDFSRPVGQQLFRMLSIHA